MKEATHKENPAYYMIPYVKCPEQSVVTRAAEKEGNEE